MMTPLHDCVKRLADVTPLSEPTRRRMAIWLLENPRERVAGFVKWGRINLVRLKGDQVRLITIPSPTSRAPRRVWLGRRQCVLVPSVTSSGQMSLILQIA